MRDELARHAPGCDRVDRGDKSVTPGEPRRFLAFPRIALSRKQRILAQDRYAFADYWILQAYSEIHILVNGGPSAREPVCLP